MRKASKILLHLIEVCLLSLEKHGDYLMVNSVIDNLLKGASGQALQNMNLIFGLPEDRGLRLKASAF